MAWGLLLVRQSTTPGAVHANVSPCSPHDPQAAGREPSNRAPDRRALAAPALAQTAPVKTFDLEQVALSPGGQHSLLLSTGDILAKGALRLSLAAQYQRDPLVFVRMACARAR